MIEITKVENDLISEIKLKPLQAKVFLLVTCHGKMSAQTISEELKISSEQASTLSKELMTLGAFIDITDTEYEAMHPRFTAVNMYRKYCEREKIEFKRNKIVDNIGVILEKPYSDARTK